MSQEEHVLRTLFLPDDLDQKLTEFAACRGMTRGEVIRAAILESFKKFKKGDGSKTSPKE